ncbi:MAG: glutaredoxin [Verrucomicrobiae bacterium]|nr:glutaredoxin [Verrucomicrobiae bacterium]
MTSPVTKPRIVAWMKPSCGWSQGVRAVLNKYNLPFEDRDIINNPDFYQEMVEKTGQMLQPSLEVNGQILADVSGEEVERWLLQQGLVSPNSTVPPVPINQPCAHEVPGAPADVGFRR